MMRFVSPSARNSGSAASSKGVASSAKDAASGIHPALLFVFVVTTIASAQPVQGQQRTHDNDLTSPIRSTVHVAPGVPGFGSEIPVVPPLQSFPTGMATSSHDVLEVPGEGIPFRAHRPESAHRSESNAKEIWQEQSQRWIDESPFRSSMQRQHHARRQKPGPMIPNANRRPVWKTPYSYGYFGASAKKQWTKAYGFHDRDILWILR